MGVNLGSAYGSIEIGTAGAESALSSLSGSLKRLGGGLSLGVTAPLAGIGAMALKSAADFETSLNQMQATTGATADQMDALEQQALDLGASTSFSAGEAAEAMLELGKAGLSVEQTSAAIAGVMDLAAAGGLGLADAATITANALNAFGLEASESTAVANTFAAAANASSADVTDLAQGFQMAGAVFAANGQSVDDLAASLAILANNGIAGSDAGTSLKTMMMRLAASTDEATAVINELGISVYDAQGEMLPFGEIIEQLETATAGMSDAQRNAALQTIFGADAIRAATILAAEGGAAFANMKDAVTAQGAASSMAQARMAGLGGAMEYFKGSVESLLIGAALPFMDALSGMVRGAADLISQLGTLTPEQQRLAAILGVVAAAAGPVLLALSALTAALGVLLSPIGLVVAAVALLGVAWATNFGGIQEKAAAAWAVIVPALQAIGLAVQGFYGILATGEPGDWYGWWEDIAGIVGEEWADRIHAAGEAVLEFRRTFLDAIRQLAAFLLPAFERIKTAIMGVPEQFAGLQGKLEPLKAAFMALVTALRPVGELIGAIIVAGIDLLMNAVGSLIEALAPLTGAALDALTNGLSAAATVVDGLVQAFQGLIAGDPKAVFDGLLLSMMGLGEFIQGTFAAALDALQIAIGAIGTAIVNSLADWGFPAAAAQVQEVIEKVMALVGWIGQLVSGEVVDIQLPQWLADLLEWKWPEIEIGVPGWLSDLLDWIWPDIEIPVPGWLTNLLDWDWPSINISVPGWLSRLLDWDWPSIPDWLGGGGGGNATGANYFGGGLTGINERGGESAVLPRGTKILTAPQTNAMLAAQAAGAGGITVNMPVQVVNSEMDFYTIAYRVAEVIQRRAR